MHEMIGVDFEHHDLGIVGRDGITMKHAPLHYHSRGHLHRPAHVPNDRDKQSMAYR